MTDNEIKKALECCVSCDCHNCPFFIDKSYCKDIDLEEVLDLIDRQKAEIERLKKNIDGLNIFTKNHINVIRLQAIKEFTERICSGRVSNDPVVIVVRTELECIKEMTE